MIQTASIGDVILATSLIETLHQAYPEAQIDFLAKKGMEGLFISHPFLSGFIYGTSRIIKTSICGDCLAG